MNKKWQRINLFYFNLFFKKKEKNESAEVSNIKQYLQPVLFQSIFFCVGFQVL